MSRFVLCACVLPLMLASLSCASDDVVCEYQLTSEGNRPQAITIGPDGNLWVTEVLKHKILRVTSQGKISEFPIPGSEVGVIQGIAAGTDGCLWFT